MRSATVKRTPVNGSGAPRYFQEESFQQEKRPLADIGEALDYPLEYYRVTSVRTLLQRLVAIVSRVAFCQIVDDLKYRPTCVRTLLQLDLPTTQH